MGFFSSCEHDWVHDSTTYGGLWNDKAIEWHKCRKCGKKEKCVIVGGKGPYLGTGYCSKCSYGY